MISFYNEGMFFAALCLLIVILLANGVKPDVYGWIMLVGTGWFAGYMDGRLFQRFDQDKDRVMPPDESDNGNDVATFGESEAKRS